MTLMRFDPFRELDRLADQALTSARTGRTLPMEALRRGDQFIVSIDVPGTEAKDIDLTVERNVVEITARRQPIRQEGDEVIVDERPQGEFRRQLFLGSYNLDLDHPAPICDEACSLVVPTSSPEASKPRKVQIGGSDDGRQTVQTGSAPRETVNA